MSYVATRKVNIGGKIFKAGDTITGVSEDRCQHLLGRFLMPSEDWEDLGEETTESDNDDDDSLESMTNAELEKMAEELGVDVPSRANKATIIKAIEDASE